MATTTTLRKTTTTVGIDGVKVIGELYDFTVDQNEETGVFHCLGASSVFFVSNRALTPKLPSIDDNGNPEATEAAFVIPTAGNEIVASTANTAGHISGSTMPPFFCLKEGNAGAATGSVYITY